MAGAEPQEPQAAHGLPVGVAEAAGSPGPGGGGRARGGLRWLRGRPVRWVAAGAAAVVVVGGAAAVALHHEGEGHRGRAAAAEDDRGSHGGRDDQRSHDGGRSHGGGQDRAGREAGPWKGGAVQAAPAPLPSVDAAEAVVKASSGVPGGKVESLRAVAEQGGGRAWQAVVVGPDGVRHLVTVDGANDTVTGNTVLGR